MIHLLSEFTTRVFPLLLVLSVQEVLGLTQPIDDIRALLRDNVDLKAMCLEDIVRMENFGNEHACWVAVVQGSSGRCHGDDGASGERHLSCWDGLDGLEYGLLVGAG